MNQEQIIKEIVSSFDLPSVKDAALNREWLAVQVNELLNHDFPKLVSLLYRIDVSEKKLRDLLTKHTNTDAGLIIADLLIERQLQKTASWEKHRKENKKDNDENERW